MLRQAIGACLAVLAAGHGFLETPRCRGAIVLPRVIKASGLHDLLSEEQVGGRSGWAKCPHCSNGGGVDVLSRFAPGGKWAMYEPLKGNFRAGVSICGDRPGSNDHTASGIYAAPAALPFVATYAPGSVANFRFDINTPHGGFLQFYLCDVSKTGDIGEGSFTGGDCHLLERAASRDCDEGNDRYKCGPVDKADRSRWYLPCRRNAMQFQNHIVGGGGSMTFNIPNVRMEKAVVHMYWLTANSCNPRGFREYFESGVWPAVRGCPGDGNTVGGFNSDHIGNCDTQAGKFPEEFFSCADVQIVGGGDGAAPAAATAEKEPALQAQSRSAPSNIEIDRNGERERFCVAKGNFCQGKTCCEGRRCSRVRGDGKVGRVCN